MRKLRVLRAIIVMMALFSIVIPFSSLAYDEGNSPYYMPPRTTEDVYARTGPTKSATIYTCLPKGSLVNVINDEDPSGWVEVWIDERVCFVYKDYISYNYDPTVVTGVGPGEK